MTPDQVSLSEQLDSMPTESQPGEPRTDRGARALAALFTVAIFASAFLLFLVQPMFGKMALPLLGGSPGVWNACMLFFQMALLAGYLYADLGSRWLDVRRQWLLHLGLAAAALLVLPISIGSLPAGGEAPIPWLLGTMLVSLGVPFVVLAGTGPLLQRWFAQSGHPEAREPYHLYAASNLGSMLALLAYPLIMEPRLRLAGQSRAWAGGFVVLVVLIAACGLRVWHAGRASEAEPGPRELDPEMGATDSPSVRERLLWIALAFIPSSLLLGVTAYITTDLAPAPLFWVLPLALYLFSFTLAFARRQFIPREAILAIQPAILAAVLIVLFRADHLGRPGLAIPLHLLALFVTGLVCHGELARRRPPVRHLTEFYLWIAVGGALGGVFNVLVAPVIFSRLWEYPLALILACLLRPWRGGVFPGGGRNLAWPLRSLGLALLLVMLSDARSEAVPAWLFLVVAVLTIYLIRRTLGYAPLWLAVCLAEALVVRSVADIRAEDTVLVERSFYGQFRVTRPPGFTVLLHGSTLHGAQSDNPARRREPLTYYVERGPFADIMALLRNTNPRARVAVVGLGTGTTAAYAMPGDEWTFYELDPGIARVARDPRYFTYLSDSPAPVRVVLGDARLSMQREEGRVFDLIVLDAFSSDAIPTHLLTREAMAVYLRRLAPGGRIAIHISNRYIDLQPVVDAVARSHGLATLVGVGPADSAEETYRSTATWVVVARDPGEFGVLPLMERWGPLDRRDGYEAWSDDFSSLWSVLRW